MPHVSSTVGWFRALSILLAAFALACGDDDGARPDAGSDAGGAVDAHVSDTGGGGDDAAAVDAGPGDAGGPTYDDPAVTSGTRLRRRYVAASAGASMSVDFWDTDLEAACSFRTAADGALRCLPVDLKDVYFADSGCAQPIYQTQTSGCDSGWAFERNDGAIYRRTTMPAVLSGGFYYRSDDRCSGPIGISAEDEFWVAEHVPSVSFVRGTRADESRADGMVARFIAGEDGSRILDETVHGTRGYTCTFDEDGRCVVPPETIGTYYLDATCSERIHPEYASLPDPVMLTDRILDSRRCPSDVRYYERGARVTAATIYARNVSGICTAQPRSTFYNFYRRGADIPVTSLPQAMVANEGDGPLQARRWVDTAGAPLGTVHAFWDTTRDEECEPMERAGASFACVPRAHGHVIGYYFADAACSDTMQVGFSQCPAGAPRLLVERESGACQSDARIAALSAAYERGAEVGPDYWFENDFVTCEMRTFSAAESGYRLGPEATSSLPSVELRTE